MREPRRFSLRNNYRCIVFGPGKKIFMVRGVEKERTRTVGRVCAHERACTSVCRQPISYARGVLALARVPSLSRLLSRGHLHSPRVSRVTNPCPKNDLDFEPLVAANRAAGGGEHQDRSISFRSRNSERHGTFGEKESRVIRDRGD